MQHIFGEAAVKMKEETFTFYSHYIHLVSAHVVCRCCSRPKGGKAQQWSEDIKKPCSRGAHI